MTKRPEDILTAADKKLIEEACNPYKDAGDKAACKVDMTHNRIAFRQQENAKTAEEKKKDAALPADVRDSLYNENNFGADRHPPKPKGGRTH